VTLPDALTVLVGLGLATVLVGRVPRLLPTARELRDVAVVIPARNEAHNLPGLLADLQRAAPAQLLVVDDASTDDTAEVARHAGATVLAAGERPAGWNPKSWAVHVGTAAVEHPVVVLLDADVRLAPGGLAAVVAALDAMGGLLSVAPRHDTGGVVELASVPFNVVALLGAAAGRRPAAGGARAAFGPCIAVRTADLTAVGGHAAVRGELLDDVALAHRFRACGLGVSLRRGGSLVRYRMYPDGPVAIVQGWSKNIAAGARRTPTWAVLATVPFIGACALPLVRAATDLRAAAVLWLAVTVGSVPVVRAVARPTAATALLPVLAVGFMAVTLRSTVLLVLRRPVRWKDRRLHPGARG